MSTAVRIPKPTLGVIIASIVLASLLSPHHAQAQTGRRPILPFLALTPPGEPVPAFDFPLLEGGRLRSADLRGHPALITLWSTDCPWGRPALNTVARLDAAFRTRGVTVVVLGGNTAAELRAYEDSARTGLTFAVAGDALPELFDRSATAPPDPRGRIEFVLPSHLIVDRAGRVVYRDFGGDLGRARAVLDSLVRTDQ